MSELRLQDFTLRRGRGFQLGPLNLTITSGELVALVGPSGSGKSTLLRALGGLEPACSGQLLVDGQDLTRARPARRNMAMVSEPPGLFPQLTVAQNIALAARQRPELEDLNQAVAGALVALDLGEWADYFPDELSSGYRARAALAQVLARRPALLCFDEPLSHVDPISKEQLITQILRVHRNMNCMTFYVTHDLREVLGISDRIVILRNGLIVQDDFTEEVYRHPRDVTTASYLGATTLLQVKGTLQADRYGQWRIHTRVLGQSLQVAAPAPKLDKKDSGAQSEGTYLLSGYPDSIRLWTVDDLFSKADYAQAKTVSGGVAAAGGVAAHGNRIDASPNADQVTGLSGPAFGTIGKAQGQVVENTFQGDQYLTTVETELGCVKALQPLNDHPFLAGETVLVELLPDRLWAIPVEHNNFD